MSTSAFTRSGRATASSSETRPPIEPPTTAVSSIPSSSSSASTSLRVRQRQPLDRRLAEAGQVDAEQPVAARERAPLRVPHAAVRDRLVDEEDGEAGAGLLVMHAPSLRGARRRKRHEPAREAGQQVDAREPGPFAVRLEQLVRLLRLDGAPPRSAEASLTRPRSRASPRSGRPSPSRQTMPTDHGPRPGSRSIVRRPRRRDECSRSRSIERQRRSSVAPRRACSPSARSSGGEKRPSAAVVGGAWRRVPARRGRRHGGSAARSRGPACQDQLAAERAEQRLRDGPERTGRRPRRRRVASPISGSSAKRGRNSEWSASRARQKRSCSRPCSLAARRTTAPSGCCQACASSGRRRPRPRR